MSAGPGKFLASWMQALQGTAHALAAAVARPEAAAVPANPAQQKHLQGPLQTPIRCCQVAKEGVLASVKVGVAIGLQNTISRG